MTSPTVRTRFAPSPTGYLHIGGARTALFNWLYARHHGGQFILRIEDTDAARNTEEARTAILTGLDWLGIDWDEGPTTANDPTSTENSKGNKGPYYQSQRNDIYDRHFEKLQAGDHLYEDNGAWRFRFPDRQVTIDDQICGSVSFDPKSEPDMTIRRPDGSYIFHFVNVIDDLEMGITHVLRGEDHLSNTWKHLLLFDALGATPPVYAHIPLLLNQDGSKMSKRDTGSSIQSYIDDGFLPEAVLNYIALLGWNPKNDQEKISLEDIIEKFGFDGIQSSNAVFDLQKCTWLNGQYIADLPPRKFTDQACKIIAAHPDRFPLYDEETAPEILSFFQTKVRTFSELPDMVDYVFHDDYTPDSKALEKLSTRENITSLLKSMTTSLKGLTPWTEDAISDCLTQVAEANGVKKGALMFPCRVAASGQSGGPDLLPLLVFLGQTRTVTRLTNTTNSLTKS